MERERGGKGGGERDATINHAHALPSTLHVHWERKVGRAVGEGERVQRS